MVPLAADGPGARRSGRRTSRGCSSTRRPRAAARDAARRVVRLPHQSRRSRSGTPRRSARRWRAFRSSSAFAYTRDETNHFADVLLPDATDLESLQLIRIGGTKYIEQFWDHEGFALRQPAVAAAGEARDFTDIATELARRTGCSKATTPPSTAAPRGVPLKGAHGDFSLDPARDPRPRRDLGRRVPRRERRAHRRRERTAWTGGRSTASPRGPFPQRLVPLSDAGGARPALRAALPGAAGAHRRGARAAAARARHALVGQAARTNTRRCRRGRTSPALGDARAQQGRRRAEDYPFWLLTARSMQYAWGGNVGMQMIKEVADNIAGHRA